MKVKKDYVKIRFDQIVFELAEGVTVVTLRYKGRDIFYWTLSTHMDNGDTGVVNIKGTARIDISD